jgi:hypothetical protein
MEFERDQAGTLTALPAPSIDTGMGLERISAVMQGTLSNYDTPLFTPVIGATSTLAGRPYGRSMEPADISMRVVADHLRAMTFLIADGVVPSNEWRGYVLRKIMRRAMRHGRKLGLHEPFLTARRRPGDGDGRRHWLRSSAIGADDHGGSERFERYLDRPAGPRAWTAPGTCARRRGVPPARHLGSEGLHRGHGEHRGSRSTAPDERRWPPAENRAPATRSAFAKAEELDVPSGIADQ